MAWFSAVIRILESVKEKTSDVLQKAKRAAGEALEWLANKSEQLVDEVKANWPRFKPHLQRAHAAIKMFAAKMPWPWLEAALASLDRLLDGLMALENSPVLHALERAIRFVASWARKWKSQAETETEHSEFDLEEARQHQQAFRAAATSSNGRDFNRQASLWAAVNHLEIVKRDLEIAIQTPADDLEHYLRIRATQKLVIMAEHRFREAKTIEEINEDDLLILKIASGLIQSQPELSAEAAEGLDSLLQRRYQTRLQPFVYSELVISWEQARKQVEQDWEQLSAKHAKDYVQLRRLKIAKDIQGELDAEEDDLLKGLDTSVPIAKRQLDSLGERSRDLERLVGAAEGFLQLLEKTEEDIRSSDQAYLLEDGPKVGKLLMRCAEKNLRVSDLTLDEQALITAFANIFRAAAKERLERIVQVSI